MDLLKLIKKFFFTQQEEKKETHDAPRKASVSSVLGNSNFDYETFQSEVDEKNKQAQELTKQKDKDLENKKEMEEIENFSMDLSELVEVPSETNDNDDNEVDLRLEEDLILGFDDEDLDAESEIATGMEFHELEIIQNALGDSTTHNLQAGKLLYEYEDTDLCETLIHSSQENALRISSLIDEYLLSTQQ